MMKSTKSSIALAGACLLSAATPALAQCGTFDADVLEFELVQEIDPITVGFAILEGPVWVDGTLFMSHVGYASDDAPSPADLVYLDENDEIQTYESDVGCNGMFALSTSDDTGYVVAACHGDPEPRVAVINVLDGSDEISLVSDYNGDAFISPNDAYFSETYNVLYFSDPYYQAMNGLQNENSSTRAYYVSVTVDADGVPSVGGDATPFDTLPVLPNGVYMSADETTLFVGATNGLFMYDINDDGSVDGDSETQVLEDDITGVDGMTRDCAGNLYVTASGYVVVVSEDLEILASVEVSGVTNVVFGGDDGTTLYATALGGSPSLWQSPSALSGDGTYSIDASGSSSGSSALGVTYTWAVALLAWAAAYRV